MKKFDKWLENGGIMQIEAWRRDGMCASEIARRLGIGMRTLIRKRKKFPELDRAMQMCADQVDIMVENAVLKRALGFSTVEVKTVEKANGQTEVTKTEKEVPPDLSAAATWLKNRRPDRWRDKPAEGNSANIKAVDMVLGRIDEQAGVIDKPM